MSLDRDFSPCLSFAAAEGEHLCLCGERAEDDPEAPELRLPRKSRGEGGASGQQRGFPDDHGELPEEDEAGGAGRASAEW